MSLNTTQTPLNDCTNSFGLLTPPSSTIALPSFNDQFTAAEFFSTNENERESPATIEPQRKRRKLDGDESFGQKTDEQVWSLSDEEIVEKQFAKLPSNTWKHYNITVKREARVITFMFHCKYRDPNHPGKQPKKCEKTRTDPSTEQPVVPYNESRHRAICALRCAANKRSFASQDDPWYRMEVELLRPGTIPPSSKLVEQDIGLLYVEYAKVVRWYFEKRARSVHCIVDGWTSPIDISYLGCGLQWEEAGDVFFMILEFIRLDARHTGEYLAQKLDECLAKYGVSKHLFLLMMDGAGNCNTTATNLLTLNPRFKGTAWRGYCFLHIIQLAAKMILSFFTKQPSRKKRTVKVAVSATQTEEVTLDGAPVGNQEDADLVQLLDEDAAEREAIRNQDPSGAARNEHDNAVVSKIRVAAINEMAGKGVTIDQSQSKTALQVIPRICGLARKVHDSSPVGNAFAKLVDEDKTIIGQTQTLARRCGSRWNTDYDSLDTALILESPVRELFKNKDLNLKAYKLTEEQWNLAADLRDVLEVFCFFFCLCLRPHTCTSA
ncbi:Dimer-Tnp-hAT domain-containing protein [Mycena sanguinolenta]|uniref:Dimer-Tnp-hAT domain-containing protein n=1 Tax=Mycena sanguinolenta TaxID=230812 RepID=A0A8H6YQH6_9AGAR|nr:Dimer-Tnp-hAT domain-containing protein [Mycena sanguinolenta]